MLERWTRVVLRFRWVVLSFWLVVALAGGYASGHLNALLSNTFTVPGTDSETVRTILQKRFGDRSDGEFLVVFRSREPLPSLQQRLDRAAPSVPGGRPTPLRRAGDLAYGSVLSGLALAKAKGYTDDLLHALGNPPGGRTYVTGQAAIEHDLDPIFSEDLRRGEFEIAIPIALVVLVLVFGLSVAVTMPLLFAAATIMGTLGLVYGFAHWLTMATYVTNLVQLIGLGIAIDYSLLVIYRFREELQDGDEVEEAIVRTMRTAGRAVIFSGTAVAIGLALLLFMPLPFMRSMGVGGFLIPLVSLAAAVTLQPALLSLYGRRGTARVNLVPARWRRVDPENGFWARLARSIMRRPYAFLAGGAALLVA